MDWELCMRRMHGGRKDGKDQEKSRWLLDGWTIFLRMFLLSSFRKPPGFSEVLYKNQVYIILHIILGVSTVCIFYCLQSEQELGSLSQFLVVGTSPIGIDRNLSCWPISAFEAQTKIIIFRLNLIEPCVRSWEEPVCSYHSFFLQFLGYYLD